MKRSTLFTLLFIIATVHTWAATYYVSTTGNNASAGTLALPWRTLTYAASAAVLLPGDIVYVKAGDYGNENVVFTKSGTAGNPITFQGYKTTPGDAPPLIASTASASTVFSTADMPTFTGSSRSSGIGFNARNCKYLEIKNFQIRSYAYGFLAGGAGQDAGNLVLDNVNAMTLGNTASSYSGLAFSFGSMGTLFSNNNVLTNCLAINAGAEGFTMAGNKNSLTGCKVFCNENTGNASTDYYIMVCGDSNTVTSCHAERLAGISHNGHGIGAKTNAEQVIDQGLAFPSIAARYNKFYNCTAVNMGESFYVRHRTAQYNLFYHCKATGTHTGAINSNAGEGTCIVTRDGASSNTFDGCIAENCAFGISFYESVEDGDTGVNPPGHPGNNNKYLNCIIDNCYIGVGYQSTIATSDAGDNTIANCTFYKTRYLHYAAAHCTKMKYIGNIYYGCLPTVSGGYFKGNTYASDIVPNGANTYFKQCDFINIQGGVPAGYIGVNGNIGTDPSFVNAGAKDYHLNSGSACIDIVDAISLGDNPADFDNKARYNGVKSDVGAFEYYAPPFAPNGMEPVAAGKTAISIYPNPSNGVLNITAAFDATYRIDVVNMVGQSVYQGAYTSRLDLTELKAGIYFLQILSAQGEKLVSRKISKQ